MTILATTDWNKLSLPTGKDLPLPQQPLYLPQEIVDSQFLDIFTTKMSDQW